VGGWPEPDPRGEEPYFLRAGEGPRHVLFGHTCFQVLTGAQSRGRMAMTVTEGPTSAPVPSHHHDHTYETIYCLRGRMRGWTAGQEHELTHRIFPDPSDVPPVDPDALAAAAAELDIVFEG
jgi:uncharacterized RmlC-like cupin family protein